MPVDRTGPKAVISLSVEVKNIDVGTLLTFRFFFYSDGVLCFWSIVCVIFLSVEVKNHLQVRVCAYRRIDIISRVIIVVDAAISFV